jgi:hypothetical protein
MDVTDDPLAIKRAIGVVSESDAVSETLTALRACPRVTPSSSTCCALDWPVAWWLSRQAPARCAIQTSWRGRGRRSSE